MGHKYLEGIDQRMSFSEFAAFTEQEYKLIGCKHPKDFKTFREFYNYFIDEFLPNDKDGDLFTDADISCSPLRFIQHKINKAK